MPVACFLPLTYASRTYASRTSHLAPRAAALGPVYLQSQHVFHREPALPPLDPSRRLERATRERGAIPRAMADRNRFRRSVEAKRVGTGNGARTRRRDWHIGRVARLRQHALHRERGA